MAGWTDAEAHAILNAYFRAQAFTFPTSLWLLLSTTTIADDGSNITEPVGNGYARLQITANTVNWAAPSGRQVTNALDFRFPDATGSWGTIVDFAGMTTATLGTPKVFGTLLNPVAIAAPQTPIFFSGTLIVRSFSL